VNARLAALDSLSSCLRVGKTTEHVAALERDITEERIEWSGVISLASARLLSPTLWVELHRHGLLDSVPAEVASYLGEVHRLNTLRNRRLQAQLTELLHKLNATGIEPVLLKGAVSLYAINYDDPGSRMLTDIDILVPRQKAIECWHLLISLGYVPVNDGGDYSHHNHLEPLSRAGEYAVVEIHRDVLRSTVTGRLFGVSLTQAETEQITRYVNNSAERIVVDGAVARVPSPTARVMHCLLHAALSEFNAYRSGTLPLRSLYELSLLVTLFGDEIDWDLIRNFLKSGRKPQMLQAWIYLAHRLFGCALPPGWEATPRALSHYLRCRLQARWGVSMTLLHFART
jgi:hypothetical protein